MKDEPKKGTSVNVVLDAEDNDLLTRSKSINSRSKRSEATCRLSHHLKVFGVHWQSANKPEKS